MADEGALERPEIAELHCFVDDALGIVVLGQLIGNVAALLDLLLAHVARALGDLQVVRADLGKDVVLIVELDDLAARRGAEAETVGNDERAGLLDHAGHVQIVDLGADDGDAGTIPRFRIDLALLDLLQGLLQIGKDLRLRAAVSHEVQDVELITGDGRVLHLTHLADLGDDLADFVVLLHGLAKRLVRRINAVCLFQDVQETVADLGDIVLQGIVRDLVRDVGMGHKDLLLWHIRNGKKLNVLHAAVHLGAGVYTGDGVEEVVASLNGALDERTAVLTGVVGHVVGRNVKRTCLRCSQTD